MSPINSRNTSTRRSLPFPSNIPSTTIKPNSTSNSSLSKSITSSLSKSTSTPLPTSTLSQQTSNQSRRQSVIPQSNRPISITTTPVISNQNNNNNHSTNNNRTPTLPRSRNVSLNLPRSNPSNLSNLSNTSNHNTNHNNVAPLKRSPLNRNTIANFTPVSSERSRTFTTPATTPSPQVINRNLLPESMSKTEDLETEVPDDDDVEIDEEMDEALARVGKVHASKLAELRRTLTSSGQGTSMSIHFLQAELKSAQDELSDSIQTIDRLKIENRNLNHQLVMGPKDNLKRPVPTRAQSSGTLHDQLSKAFLDALQNGTENEIQAVFRSMPSTSRLHLLHLLLDASLPGDLAALRAFLAKIERTKRDLIGALPEALAVKCLMRMDLKSILTCRLVSKTWNRVISECGAELWRQLCYSLTSMDDERPTPNTDDAYGWFELYKGLYYREENWKRGLAQRVVVLKGHTGSIGAIKLRGSTLVTGSLDGTLRIWNVRTSTCLKIVKMPAPVSSVDFYGQYGHAGVVAAGGNDVGRVFLISMNGVLLSTLSGHNKGIRTLAMNSQYLVSGGYDKALVVWNWREGTRIVKFGQQTNPCAAISLFGSLFSSVQVDGVIRCFNIEAREIVSQHKVQGGGGNEVFQWFVAEARRVMIATKTKIYELEYRLTPHDQNIVDLSSPPDLVSVTPIVHELNSGTLDVLKRRFAAAPRFANRLGENMRIFIGHLPKLDGGTMKAVNLGSSTMNIDDEIKGTDCLQPIEGAWLDGEYCVSTRNPTCMSLSSDQLVVGCSDGILYALDFCGRTYRAEEEENERYSED